MLSRMRGAQKRFVRCTAKDLGRVRLANIRNDATETPTTPLKRNIYQEKTRHDWVQEERERLGGRAT